jgi:hypothetical protein
VYSLTAFVRPLKLDPKDLNICAVRDQLALLSIASILIGMIQMTVGPNPKKDTVGIDTKIVSKYDLWLPEDERQRALWP